MIIALFVIIVLTVLWLLSLRGRNHHPGLTQLQGWNYAHRGLHDQSRPENSMSAFQAALESDYGIELDVHLLKDGNLAVIHDSSLLRTTGRDGKIEDLITSQLANYTLEGSTETIPEFRQVLELFHGRAPMIIELKPDANNHAALCKAVCEMLKSYHGVYCLESFDPRCILWLRKHRPDFIRGQLAENFLSSEFHLPFLIKFILTTNMANFISQPDFIAYKFSDRKRLGVYLCRRLFHLQGVAWTLHTPEEHNVAVEEGWLPIFEGYTP